MKTRLNQFPILVLFLINPCAWVGIGLLFAWMF